MYRIAALRLHRFLSEGVSELRLYHDHHVSLVCIYINFISGTGERCFAAIYSALPSIVVDWFHAERVARSVLVDQRPSRCRSSPANRG